MQQALTHFIKALRSAEIRISPAETLEAFKTVELVGYRNRDYLKHSLAAVLAKSADEKIAFDECFERFFRIDAIQHFDENSDSVEAEENTAEKISIQPQSELGQQLMEQNRTELSAAMIAAAQAVGLQNIVLFTQKGPYTQRIMQEMGLGELQNEIMTLGRDEESPSAQALAQELRRRRGLLRERVQDYVEQQFLLHADVSGRQLREELLRKAKMANIDRRYFDDMQDIIRRMAKKLIALHSRRKKRDRRGQLHMARTLRHNMAYDGHIYDLHWRKVKIDRPKVFAICDVSGSVSNYARFMLLFLYSLKEVLPKVRAFAFSSYLGEVTELFQQQPIELALNKALYDYGGGSTDYGQAFIDFKRLALNNVDQRSTVIILGDGRNNYGNPQTKILQELHDRCRRLLWLNPEPPAFWQIGDAEMQRYSAYCHKVEHCNSLRHLERVIGRLLET